MILRLQRKVCLTLKLRTFDGVYNVHVDREFSFSVRQKTHPTEAKSRSRAAPERRCCSRGMHGNGPHTARPPGGGRGAGAVARTSARGPPARAWELPWESRPRRPLDFSLTRFLPRRSVEKRNRNLIMRFHMRPPRALSLERRRCRFSRASVRAAVFLLYNNCWFVLFSQKTVSAVGLMTKMIVDVAHASSLGDFIPTDAEYHASFMIW